jgi:Phosphodiester glycosidase/SPOR domain
MRPLALAFALALLLPTTAAAAAELPLGPAGLPEARTTTVLAPGVTHTRIVRGTPSPDEAWIVDAAFLADRAAADALAARLDAAGAPARVERIDERPPDAPGEGPQGYLVRTGRFATQAEADAERARLTAIGLTGLRTVYSGEDGRSTTGPWVVNVLETAPWRVRGALATDVVPERELLTGLAARTGALASINGGYFVIGAENGTDGDLAGISMLDGELLSEAVDGRTSLVLGPFGASVQALRDDAGVRARGGAQRVLDGVNRVPGLIRGCGGTGDQPTDAPKHDFTCTDAGELIRYTRAFGTTTPSGPGAEAVLSPTGRVLELRPARGGAIPPGASVLAGTGDAAAWLQEHARPGLRLETWSTVRGEHGPLQRIRALINGGPRLLRGGRADITAAAEGFDWPEDPGFYYRFGVRRNPRTLAGVTASGRLLLVTIDGRRPDYSVGASFAESAAVMRALGAREAVNLDGGGSTGMTVRDALVTRPSDATGERPIGDALLIGR